MLLPFDDFPFAKCLEAKKVKTFGYGPYCEIILNFQSKFFKLRFQ